MGYRTLLFNKKNGYVRNQIYIRAILLTIFSVVTGSMKNVIERYGKAKEEHQQVIMMNPNSELMVCGIPLLEHSFVLFLCLNYFSLLATKCY